MPTTPHQHDRYHRQRILPDIGDPGQSALAAARVLIVGCGALGSVTAQLLSRAGVGLTSAKGSLTLLDRDTVELTNLQRQVLFNESDIGAPKANATARAITAANTDCNPIPLPIDLDPQAARSLLHNPPTLIIDGTDNFTTRLLLNDLAVKLTIPLIYAGAVGTKATLATILPRPPESQASHSPYQPGPCLRCLMPDPPPPGEIDTCDTAGVLGPVVSVIASLQALEAIKALVGRYDLIRRVLLSIDPWLVNQQRLELPPGSFDPDCPCCAHRNFTHLDATTAPTANLCGKDAIQIKPTAPLPSLPALAQRLTDAKLGEVHATPFLVRLSPNDAQGITLAIFPDGRAIITGTTDPSRAKSLYARYVGA